MSCKHCGQPTADVFCCPACKVVYEAICGAGLSAYYQRRDAVIGVPAGNASETSPQWMNRPEVAAQYLLDGERVTFLLDGLHCAACCWLIEKAVGQLRGVREARVNYTTAQLSILLDISQVGLGDVMARVASVGYRATPRRGTAGQPPEIQAERDFIMRLGVAGFAAGNIMLLATALYAGAFSGMESSYREFFHWVSLVLSLPVIGYSAMPFLRGALAAIRHRVITMDLPIATGLLATFTYSVWATVTGQAHVYFDTVAMFVFVLLIGRSLERSSQRRVSATVERLLLLGARTARKVVDETRLEVAVEELAPGDILEVLPGEKVPVDGIVLQGQAWVNEAMLTGESAPVSKGAGSTVTGATLCVDGTLRVQATRTGSDTTLSQISALVEKAQERRPRVQLLADRAAAGFVVVILSLAALTFMLWVGHGTERALMVAVSVLIVTCPCALGLATPLAVAAASGRSASRGILFRGGDVLEALHRVTHVVLDKTGALTAGQLQLQTVLASEPDAALRLAASLERHSTHPLARALIHPGATDAVEVQTLPGLGLVGCVDGHEVLLGSETLMQQRNLVLPENGAKAAEERGETVVWLAQEGVILAAFTLADEVRPEALSLVQWLKAQGLGVTLLSGDRPGAVGAVAARTGIEDWQALASPQAKAERVAALQAAGKRVLMVGDGTNDALALSTATVGMAVSGGTDIAGEAAGILLLRPGLGQVQEALRTAHAMLRTIRGNISIGTVYNLMAIPIAMLGWVVPLAAAVAMPVSSLFVVGNSIRLWRSA